MKKILAIGLLLLVSGIMFADELTVGMSLTPFYLPEEINKSPEIEALRNQYDIDGEVDALIGFTVGYQFAGLLYAHWDATVLPPSMVYMMTSGVSDGIVYKGFFRPGFLNQLNFGVKPVLGPIEAYTSFGVNWMYIYKQEELDESFRDIDLGANWKIGAGFRFDEMVSVGLSAMALFPSVSQMFSDIGDLASSNKAIAEAAAERIMFIPSIYVNLNL